jgi:integrase/recombinase XerD
MSTKTEIVIKATALDDALLDFILSKQAILVSKRMIRVYSDTIGRFIKWLKVEDISSPEQLQTRHIRAFLASLAEREYSDSYIHCYARTIKTFVRFLHANEYTPKLITFEMPPLHEKLLPVLTSTDLKAVIDACESKRDKALILFMADTGLRRAEVCSLNWDDIDIKSGVVVLEKGKWCKPRSVMIGIKTRKVLLDYRREMNPSADSALFQVSNGKRLSPMGLRSVILRLSKKTGIHFTPHALRRTFATLALRAGMNPLHLQGLLGHSTL